MQNHKTTLNIILLALIALYFPIYSISLISGISAHRSLAAAIAAISVIKFCESKKNLTILLIVISLLALKYTITNAYQIRFITVAVIGWIVLYSTLLTLNEASAKIIRITATALWLEFIIYSTITLLQYLGTLPISLGKLTYTNTIVAGFSDNALGTIRPNGYFYHPYDLAIFLSPFMYHAITKRNKSIILWSTLISYALYLKSFFIWVIGAIAAQIKLKNIAQNNLLIVAGCTILATAITLLTISYADREFTAGRTLLWSMHLNDYANSTLAEKFFGLKQDTVSIYRTWEGEGTYPPHNSLLFILSFGGIAFLLAHTALFYKTLTLASKSSATELKLFIVVAFLSLGLSGDLTALFPFWISACIAAVLFKSRKTKSQNRFKAQ